MRVNNGQIKIDFIGEPAAFELHDVSQLQSPDGVAKVVLASVPAKAINLDIERLINIEARLDKDGTIMSIQSTMQHDISKVEKELRQIIDKYVKECFS